MQRQEEIERNIQNKKMKDSQLKNRAQMQQIENLRNSVEEIENKILEIKDLVDSKDQGEVLNKIQQIESSKKSLEDLKRTYQVDIDSINSKIEQLREKIGSFKKASNFRGVFVHRSPTSFDFQKKNRIFNSNESQRTTYFGRI